jgi:hypothetical protein
MTIICHICERQFEKQITNSHLKTHKISTIEYKKRYGDNSLSSEEYKKEKSLSVNGEKNPNFGNHLSDNSKKIISDTNKGRIAWNKNISLSTEQKEHLRKKALKRYTEGFENWNKGKQLSDDIKNKISKSVKKYAFEHKDELIYRAKKANITKNKLDGYFEQKRNKLLNDRTIYLENINFDVIEMSLNEIYIKCKNCKTEFKRISWYEIHPGMCPNCGAKKTSSKEELELATWLSDVLGSDKIIRNDRTILNNSFEIDIMIPSLQLGIEYNGLYWHSELAGKSKWYHKVKYNQMKEKGIQLIQIFEDEWIHYKEKVKQRLLSKLQQQKKYHARKCKITKLDYKTTKTFLDEYHLQGCGQPGYSFGLIFNEELIAIMTFTKLSVVKGHKNIKNKWELNRYASKGNIIGGASKLFKYFIRNFNPNEIISYSDLRWNTGKLYEKLNMTFVGETVPGYWYVKGTKRFHRFKLRKTKNDPINTSEWDLRKSQGWNRIWDCGNNKYIWKKEGI